jgi:hypothetical protein
MLVVICLLLSFAPLALGQEEELDPYKWRFGAAWWFPENSGQVFGRGDAGYFDLQKDFGFTYYSTFSANLDWHFKRKHHLLFNFSPVDNIATRTITRTINFQDQTFTIGTQATAKIRTLSFSPGYQYDFIRRKHGNLGLATQFYLLHSKVDVSGTLIANGSSVSQSASGSTFSPVPVFGPRARWYPLNSNRFSLDGWAQGMYFFGYGDMWSARGTGNILILPHLNFVAGYLLGSALSVHGTNNRIGLRLKQQGAVIGIEGSW